LEGHCGNDQDLQHSILRCRVGVRSANIS
jgi:hypothetical protein